MEIKEIDYGMAYRIGKKIYINKNLKKYPLLYNAILKHEKAHTDDFELKDLMLDLTGKYLNKVKKDYYLFFIRYPKAFVHFIPIFKLENKWTFDIIMLIVWLIFLFMMILISFIL
jgi:hypothetical protein